jgi:hypothetical protein
VARFVFEDQTLDNEQVQDTAAVSAVDTPEPATPETVEPGTTETVAETDEQKAQREQQDAEQKQRRARDRLQRRFGELTAQIRQRDAQIEQLMSVLQRNGQPAAQPQPADGAPKREAFESYEDYLEAKAEWKAEQRARALIEEREQQSRQQQQRTQQQTHVQQVVQSFATRQQEFAKSTPDYFEALESSTADLPDEIVPLLMQVPDGHIAAYAIAKTPDLAQQLWNKSQFEQAAILGSIVATYKARPSPQVSTAPPPGKPVAPRGAAASNLPSDTDSPEEWLRKRRAQLRAQG